MKLKDKTAIVTGASQGIGKAIAISFAREGANVVIADLKDASEVLSVIKSINGRAEYIHTDVSDYKSVERMVKKTLTLFGSVDILVNNAGIILRGTFLDLSPKELRRVMDVNLGGTFNCSKIVVEHMIKRGGGKILNISSVAGKIGDITASPAYGTSKGAINTLTKSMARQLADYHINVNAIAPHAIETPMSSQWDEEKRREVTESIPLKRMGKPEDVAAAALFLVSGDADFITGEILNVNGGFLMD
ncbi:MAG: short-chain dehydrogenase [Spirochaetes bacterium]|nr:MAG: short-chain dehydrogenase [Spirochaetota bacterium]